MRNTRAGWRRTLGSAALAGILVFLATGQTRAASDGTVIVPAPLFLAVDSEFIDSGLQAIQRISLNSPRCGNRKPSVCVNDDIAAIGQRAKLFTRPLGHDITPYSPLELPTGQAGDQGLFRFSRPDPQRSAQTGRTFTLAQLLSHQGNAANEDNLDKVEGVVPLTATEISALVGKTVCSLVLKGDVSNTGVVNGQPTASLKGDTRGITAFTITSARPNPAGGSRLPLLTISLIPSSEVGPVCGASVQPPAPTPTSTPTSVPGTPTPAATSTPTSVPSTPTPTPTPTSVPSTPTPTPTPTSVPSTPTPTPTPTSVPSTPTPTPTPTSVPSTPTPTSTPSNQPPLLPAMSGRTVNLGETLTLRLFADDPNPADSLTYSLPVAPAGAELDPPGSPLFRFVPSDGQVGPHTVTVRVQDGGGLADEKSFSITVVAVNRPPVLAPQPDQRIPAAGPFLRALTASDPDAGDPLAFSLVSGPAGMGLSGNVLNWTPAANQLGPSFVTVAVSDGAGASDSKRFALTVFTAAKPVARDDSYSVTAGQTLDVPAAGVLANDVDPESGTLAGQKLTDPDKGFLSLFGADGGFRFLAPPAPIPPAFAVKEKWWVQNGFGYAHPLVVDVNGDGFPDIVNFYFNDVLRALDGRDGNVLWSISGIAGCGFYLGAGAGHFAAGDLDEDGTPEIVTLGNCGHSDTPGSNGPIRVLALNHDGTLQWKSPAITTAPLPSVATLAKVSLTLARLSAGGPVKVLGLRWVDDVFGPVGARGCRIFTGDPADEAVACSATLVLSGADGSLERVLKGPEPIPNAYQAAAFEYLNFPPVAVADLDGDGVVEIVSGHIVHENGGGVRWSAPRASVDTAVADLDGDGYAEVIMLLKESTNFVRTLAVFGRDGTARWTFPFSTLGARLVVADVDADGAPDILATSNRDVWAFRRDGRILWTHKTAAAPQAGSEATGHNRPAVFDLDGDGFPEVVVQHTSGVYFLDGRDGREKAYVDSESDDYDYNHYANMPVVADVDADGHADLVITLRCGVCGKMGIRVLTSVNDDWQPAPGVWNQLNYRPSTVDGRGAIAFDGTVPKDFRVQAPIGTPVDPRERMRTAFTYAATNSALTSDPATVMIDILPENQPPVITSTPPTRFLAGVATTYQLTANDADSGDTATWSIEISDIGATDQISIDPFTGVFSYDIGNRLEYLFVVRVTDSQGGFDSQPIILSRATTTRTVPNVVGQTQTAAATTLSGAGLAAGAVAEVYSSTAAGIVVAQSPAAGVALPQGELVALTVSKGPEPVIVPNVVGKDEALAVSRLTAAGFTPSITRQFDVRPRGEVLSQTPAAGSSAAPGPATLVVSAGIGLELRLATSVVTAGDPLAFSLAALDVNGNPVAPPGVAYAVTSLAPDFVAPAPSVSGGAIVSSATTRGGFRLTATEIGGLGRVVSTDFAVTNPSSAGDFDQQALFAQQAEILEALDLSRGALDAARAAGDETGMAAALTGMVDLWRPLDLAALKFATALAPSGGFPPSAAEMVADGHPYNADDALLPSTLDAISGLLAELRDVLEAPTPFPIVTYQSLFDALAHEIDILDSLEPSPTGVVANRARYDRVVAHRLPAAMHALMSSVASRVGATPLVSTAGGIRPMFLPITLTEVSQATSIQVLLAKKLYLPTFKRVAVSAAYLLARDLLKEYTNTGDLVSVIAGASLSFHVFKAHYSAVETLGADPDIVEGSSVFLIGPNALEPLNDLVEAVKEAFKLKVGTDPSKVVKDLKEVYNKLTDLAEKAQDFADAVDPKNFQASYVVKGCLFDSSPACNALVFESGFESVYKCPENTFCPPMPILLFFWSHTGGGLAVESPVFLPTFTVPD